MREEQIPRELKAGRNDKECKVGLRYGHGRALPKLVVVVE
jgi:hypothetical protein